jgi:hypothetical protein
VFGRHTVEGSAGALVVLPEGLCCLYHENKQCSASLESCALPSEYQHVRTLRDLRFDINLLHSVCSDMFWPKLAAIFRESLSFLVCASCALTYLVGILHMIKIIIMKAKCYIS